MNGARRTLIARRCARTDCALNIGSVVGNIIVASIADRTTPYLPTGVFYFLGAIFLAVVGVSVSSSALMLSMALGAGLFGFLAQLSVTTITAQLYPSELRASGAWCAFGFGRVGGVAGLLFAGILLGAVMNFATMMAILGSLILITRFPVLCLGPTQFSLRLVSGRVHRSHPAASTRRL